jgi:hypothetical protein
MSADRIAAGIDHGKDQIAASSLHKQNHLGSGQDTRALGTEEFNGLIMAHFNSFFTLRAYLKLGHGFMQTIFSCCTSA